MSIHGDQPIPCFRQEQCAEAWEGKNYCDLSMKQCTRPKDSQPVAKSEQPTNTAELPPVDLDNVSRDTNWNQAADSMWTDLMNLGTLKVPGKPNPTLVDKLVFVFFGSPYRADITGVLFLAIAVVLFLL